MKQIAGFVLSLFCSSIILGQDMIEVADLTIKVGSKDEELIYYAFEEGDKIIFSFEEVDGKELKELEIIEYPGNSKFRDFQVKKIERKEIKVNQKGIYVFRFLNSNVISKRICKIKISRIPDSIEKSDFNTGVKWVEKFDTTYSVKSEDIIIGYKTINKQKSRRVLISTDTSVVTILDRIERVHSMTNMSNSNISYVNIQLPYNTYSPNQFLPYKSTEVLSWAYSISVGNTGEAWYKDANSKAVAKTTAELAVNAGLISSGYGALALLAIEGISVFSNPPQGDNIKFRILTNINGTTYSLGHGNSVAAFGKITEYNQGGFSLELVNDNLMDGLNVNVKVIAVTITKTWKDEYYTVQEQEPIKENQTKKIPSISVRKVPVMLIENN